MKCGLLLSLALQQTTFQLILSYNHTCVPHHNDNNWIHNNYCEFSNNDTSIIKCDVYMKNKENSGVYEAPPMRFHLELKVLDKEDTKNITPESPVCWEVTIQSLQLDLEKDVPSNAFIHPVLQDLSFLVSLQYFSMRLDYQVNSIDGHFYLPADCDPKQGTMKKTCGGADSNQDIRLVRSGVWLNLPVSEYDWLKFVKQQYLMNKNASIIYMTVQSNMLTTEYKTVPLFLDGLKIKSFNISNNYYQSSLELLFPKMLELEKLFIYNANLQLIDPGNFKNIPNLRFLDISQNQFSQVPSELGTLSNLRYLNLSWQLVNLFTKNFDEIRRMTKLEILDLSGLSLGTITRNLLPELPLLTHLGLSSCQIRISHVDKDSFSSLPSLVHIDLTRNHITSLAPDTFQSLAPLANILLAFNQLTGEDGLNLNSVQLLDFSNNQIKTPENLVIKGNIEHLNLSNNVITNWSSSFTMHSKFYVKCLNLSHNKVLIINDAMGKTLNNLNNLLTVDLGGNEFNCNDCSLKEFQNWLLGNSLRVINLGTEKKLTCSLPALKKDKAVLNATFNELECLPATMNYYLTAGLPVFVIVLTLIIIISTVYNYRFELLYMRHLWQIKRLNNKGYECMKTCEYDVFVSYSGKDRDWVMNVLLPGLENPTDRYCLCLHERDFRLGTYIMDNVVNCIDSSRRVLLVLTNNYIQSEWCKWELRMAQHRVFEDSGRDFLILLELERLDRDKLPLSLRVLMGTRTYLEWPSKTPEDTSDHQSVWKRLKEALGVPLALVPGVLQEEKTM